MADIKLSTVAGSGGAFVPSLISSGIEVSIGASGDLITLTPPAGDRVLISVLSTTAQQPNIELEIGGSVIGTGWTLNDTLSAGQIGFGTGWQSDLAPSQGAGKHEPFTGGTDEAVIVRLTTGVTAEVIYYSYQFGALK